MVIFTCEDTFESMMTCIYDAWASRAGHANLKLQLEPVIEPELFAEYRHVDADTEKIKKVVRSIQQKISPHAYRCIYAASLSFRQDKLDIIYRFLIYGFHFGPKALDMLGEPAVSALFELDRKVRNEAHFFREFTRFTYIPPSVYFAVIEPKCDVMTILAPNFVDRMPSESFIIADKNRLIAAVHPKDEDYYLTPLTREEFDQMEEASKTSDPYVPLWKSFFRTIGIEQRKNYKCQRTMLALWYRKHMTEFQQNE